MYLYTCLSREPWGGLIQVILFFHKFRITNSYIVENDLKGNICIFSFCCDKQRLPLETKSVLSFSHVKNKSFRNIHLMVTYIRTENRDNNITFPQCNSSMPIGRFSSCHDEYLLFDLLIRRESGFSKSFCHL